MRRSDSRTRLHLRRQYGLMPTQFRFAASVGQLRSEAYSIFFEASQPVINGVIHSHSQGKNDSINDTDNYPLGSDATRAQHHLAR